MHNKGKQPLQSKGAVIRVKLNLTENQISEDKANKWKVKVGNIEDSTITCHMTSSAESFIGRYWLYTDTKVKGDNSEDGRSIMKYEDRSIIILFNPWCTGKCFLNVEKIQPHTIYI